MPNKPEKPVMVSRIGKRVKHADGPFSGLVVGEDITNDHGMRVKVAWDIDGFEFVSWVFACDVVML